MKIAIIAAIAKNRVIGKEGKMPWGKSLPADLKRFKQLTMNKAVIMGSKTFQSLGKPLAHRKNIVLTRNRNLNISGCSIAHSIKEALSEAKDSKEIMIIGGASIYKQFLPLADKMYLTIIDADFEGDAFFPKYNKNEWTEIMRESHLPDKNNAYPYTFITLQRK